MARVIEELVVGIRADAGGMQAGLAKASTQTKSFGASIAKLAGPIAAAFAVSRVVSFGASILQSADAVAKQSRAIGASLEGMIGLQHAASLSGVSIEEISKNTLMLQKRLGGGEGANAIKQLGLDAMSLRTMGADKAVMEVTAALGNVQNPAQRAALAMEMFGRGGLKMLQLSSEGKDNLKAMAQEAEDLGLTLNAVEAKKFEDINDNFERMKGAIKGVAQTFLIEMAPAIMSATEKLVEFGKYINGVFSRGAEQDITALGAAFKVWQDAISGGVEGGARAAGFGSFADNMRDIAEGEEELAAAAKAAQAGPMFAPLIEAMKQFEEAQRMRGAELTEKFLPEDFAAQRAELNKLLEGGFIDQTVFDAALKDLEARDPVAKWFQKLLDAGDAALEKQKGLAESFAESVMTPWEKAQQTMLTAADLVAKGLLSVDAYNKLVQQSNQQNPQQEAAKKGEALRESVMTPWEKAQQNIQEAQGLYQQGAIDQETFRRVYDKETKALEGERPSKNIEALSGGDIVGQVRRGQLGGAMDLQQEQLNTQKRMEKWLAILAGGGVTPALSWGR